MKKFIAILLSALACCFAIISFTACDMNEMPNVTSTNTDSASTPPAVDSTPKQPTTDSIFAPPAKFFGQFGYNGMYLQSRAVEDIDYLAAKELVSSNNSYSANGSHGISLYIAQPTSSEVTKILSNYSKCKITTYYYEDGSKEKLSKSNELIGSDLEIALSNNSFSPYGQFIAQLLLASPTVLDTLEQENTDFKNMPGVEKYPFKNCNTFHKDAKGCLVIQTHAFAELSSSLTGGISVNYRQDTETSYDGDNKITHWQSSLGIITATPNGSVHQGYILEMDFAWTEKI